MSQADIKLFGRPSFAVDGVAQPLPEKAFVLLAILAAAEHAPVNRSQIRAVLWGDTDQKKANANLRQLIARIQRATERFGLPLLVISGDALSFDRAVCRNDLADLLAALRAVHGEGGSGGDGGKPHSAALLSLWTGQLLDGFVFDEPSVDEWLDALREQLRHRFVDAARGVLDAPAPEDADEAWQLALKVLDIDATEETAYRAMMRICAARGDRGLALRIFRRCKRILATELGVQPSSGTLELAAFLRHRETGPDGSSESPARGVLPARPAAAVAEAQGSAGTVRQIPSVMVLPPLSMLADDQTRLLALGFVEDVTIGLARFRRFSVVAPHSGSAVAFGSRSLEEALSVLDVDYAVATSLMPAAHGYRFAVRLTDLSSSEVLWGAEPDFNMATLRDTFERVIGLVVRSLVNSIEQAEIRAPIPEEAFTAYRRYLEGRRLLHKTDLQSIRRARRFFREAIAQAPDYSAAMIGYSRTLSDEWLVRGLGDRDMLQESTDLALKAARLDPHDGRAKREEGYASLYLRRYDESLACFEEALKLNPHDADIMADYADALAHSGEPKRGLELCLRAIELNPIPPDDYVWTLGSIYYQLGEYQQAMEALRQVEDSPATARLLAACAARLGQTELAKRFSRVVRSVYPNFEAEAVRSIVPNRNAADTEHLIDGLRLAGLG